MDAGAEIPQNLPEIEERYEHQKGERIAPDISLEEENLKISISVLGNEFRLPEFAIEQLQISAKLANHYKKSCVDHRQLFRRTVDENSRHTYLNSL